MKNKSIVIICGDPKSTFNEILTKTLKKRVLKNSKFPLILIGSKKLLENEFGPKYDEIKKSINEIGFEETARIYSLSDSKKSGGNLGWIYKNQLSKEVKDELDETIIGNFTKPIITSGGFLILKLNDIKSESIEIDKDAQLKKMIEFERQRQFTTFSTLYYKRIYNIAEINEK